MKKLILTLIFLLVASFIIVIMITRVNRDERQIRRNLISLATMLSQSISEDGIMALANIQRIKSLFTPDCQIAAGAPIPEIIGRDMLVSTIHWARRIINEIDINFYDISIIMGDNHIRARTIMTATATGFVPQKGERIIEAREIEMRWKKVEGLWKIAEVRLVQVLR